MQGKCFIAIIIFTTALNHCPWWRAQSKLATVKKSTYVSILSYYARLLPLHIPLLHCTSRTIIIIINDNINDNIMKIRLVQNYNSKLISSTEYILWIIIVYVMKQIKSLKSVALLILKPVMKGNAGKFTNVQAVSCGWWTSLTIYKLEENVKTNTIWIWLLKAAGHYIDQCTKD